MTGLSLSDDLLSSDFYDFFPVLLFLGVRDGFYSADNCSSSSTFVSYFYVFYSVESTCLVPYFFSLLPFFFFLFFGFGTLASSILGGGDCSFFLLRILDPVVTSELSSSFLLAFGFPKLCYYFLDLLL